MVILTNITAPTEGIKLIQESVQAYIGQESLGNGTLFVAESTLSWLSNDASNKGFAVTYPSIVLHAISTDLTNFAQEHLYVLVDGNKSERRRRRGPLLMTNEEAQHQQDLQVQNQELNGGDESDDDDSESGRSIEIRFVPDDKGTLTQMYHEVCVCQELNPDENDSFSEDGEDMEYDPSEDVSEHYGNGNGDQQRWFTAENVDQSELSEEGRANLARMLGGGRLPNGNHENGHDDDSEQME